MVQWVWSIGDIGCTRGMVGGYSGCMGMLGIGGRREEGNGKGRGNRIYDSCYSIDIWQIR